MRLPGWLSSKRRSKVARVFRLDRIDLFESTEPLMRLYDDAIQIAQHGVRDNVSKRMRYTVLAQLGERAIRTFPDSDLIECGCLFGHSTHMLATLMQAAAHRGELHVFDSFEGLSEFDAEDYSEFTPDEASTTKKRKHFEADYGTVSASLSKYPFVHLYKGWIPTQFHKIEHCRFGFASIDVDLYKPTLDSLAFIFPRLVDGGMIYFDDYGYRDFPGARKAVDEYLADRNIRMFLRLPSGAAILMK